MRILLIEDDEDVADILKTLLTTYRYAVDVESDGAAGLALAETFPYDLLILDITLPKVDGISICQRLRRDGCQAPILILTGRNTSEDKVTSLNIGADDYVVKPFDQAEFIARVQALLRRGNINNQPILQWGEIQLDPSQHSVTCYSHPLSLTPKEYGILELFLRNVDRVFSLGMIIDHVWPGEEIPGDEAVRVHIKGLRKKLRAAGASHDFIETLYGVGYRLKPIPNSLTVATTVTEAPAQQRQRAESVSVVTSLAEGQSLSSVVGSNGSRLPTQVLVASSQLEPFNALQAHLTSQGWTVRLVRQPGDFWPQMQAEQPHAIILDMQMILDYPVGSKSHQGGMSAIAVCEHLRAHPQWQSVPIVVILPDIDPQCVAQMLSMGVDDFLVQPITADELIARVQLRLSQVQGALPQPLAFPTPRQSQMQNPLFNSKAM